MEIFETRSNGSHSRGQVILLASLLVFAGLSAYPQKQRAVEYEVYDAVVQHMFAGGITRFDMNASVERLVIRDHTYSKNGPGRERWDQVKMRLGGELNDAIIADYESKQKDEKELKTDLEVPFEYTLVRDEQLNKIFGDRKDYDKSFQAWAEFYRLYPKSAGYNSFSRVGLDKENRRALVYFVNWCGTLCGTGNYVFLEKVASKWKVAGSAMMWIS